MRLPKPIPPSTKAQGSQLYLHVVSTRQGLFPAIRLSRRSRHIIIHPLPTLLPDWRSARLQLPLYHLALLVPVLTVQEPSGLNSGAQIVTLRSSPLTPHSERV